MYVGMYLYMSPVLEGLVFIDRGQKRLEKQQFASYWSFGNNTGLCSVV